MDPHHHPPHQFPGFPPFAAANPFTPAQSLPFFAAPANPSTVSASNNNVFQAPMPTPPPPETAPPPQSANPFHPHPSFDHPPYADMICSAIAALNEPDGSSKQAISRYIERVYSGLPPAHGALLTHHLKTLKNSGVLVMVKKSYKFVSTHPPASIAIAAAAAAAGFDPLRSDVSTNANNDLSQSNVGSETPAETTPPTQKRGRGRPPKPKPDSQPNETPIQPNFEQEDVSVSQPPAEVQPTRRPPGRPRKNGPSNPSTALAVVTTGSMKRRGRPPGRREAGRQRKPKSVIAPPNVYAYVTNAVRRRGRPRKVDSGVPALAPANPEDGQMALVLPAKRRGRPPKFGGIISRPMKPKRGVSRTGRPVGRPKKNAQWAVGSSSGQQDATYGELKRKIDLFQEKVKEAVDVLKAEVSSENQAVAQIIQELEGLITVAETSEQQHKEEEEAEEENEEEREGEEGQGEEQTEEQGRGHGQGMTEAEAMQEALF